MHGMELPKDMLESTRLVPALFTPSTKAEIGDKDENIHPDRRTSLLRCRGLHLPALQSRTSFPTRHSRNR